MFYLIQHSAIRDEDEIIFTGSYDEALQFGLTVKHAMSSISTNSRQDSFFLESVADGSRTAI